MKLLLLTGILLLLLAGCGGPTGMNSSQTGGFGEYESGFSSTPGGGARRASNAAASSLWDMQALKRSPKAETIGEKTEKVDGADIIVREVKYQSPAAAGREIGVFAYYAFPASKRSTRLPAIVWVHGGGSVSDRSAVVEWASRGYAVIGMDLPGKGGETRTASRSEGPDMTDDLIFKVSPSPKESYLYLCVNTVCRAISFLSDQKEVDPGRVGVLGYSWGGVITLLTDGIDDRVAAACAVYGAGYIPDESYWSDGEVKKLTARDRKTWREHFDPSSYLAGLHAKTLFVGASQDSYFPLRSFVRTFEGAQCPKALYIAPNKNHQLDDAGSRDVERWFDWALRSGTGLPTVKVKHGKAGIEVMSMGDPPVVGASLVTCEGSDYMKAVWKSTDVKASDGICKLDSPKPGVPSMVVVHDDSGGAVVVDVSLPGRK